MVWDQSILPWLLGASAGLLLLAAGLHLTADGWSRWWVRWQRMMRLSGAIGSVAILAGSWWFIQVTHLTNDIAWLIGGSALILALLIGVVLPGIPTWARQRWQTRLVLQTVDLLSYLRFVERTATGRGVRDMAQVLAPYQGHVHYESCTPTGTRIVATVSTVPTTDHKKGLTHDSSLSLWAPTQHLVHRTATATVAHPWATPSNTTSAPPACDGHG